MSAVLQIARFGEQGLIPSRSERFYKNNNEWFFSVRSGFDQGPYSTFDAAREALTQYIESSLSKNNSLPRN